MRRKKKNSPSNRSTFRMVLGGNMVILWSIQMEHILLYIIIIFIFGVLIFTNIQPIVNVVVPSMVVYL